MTDTRSRDSLLASRYAIGAAIGLAVIATTYSAAGYGQNGYQWVAPVTLAIAIALVDVLAHVRRLLPFPGVAPATLLAVMIGMYLCVPETGQIRVAVIFPLLVIALEVFGRRQVGLEWYAVAATAVFWAGMFGTAERPSALVGALFAWWAILLVGAINLLRPIRSSFATAVVVLIGTAAAWGMARIGGLGSDGRVEAVATAAAAAVVSFVVALVAVQLFDRSRELGGGQGDSGGGGVSARQ
jgi:hypothetical protein